MIGITDMAIMLSGLVVLVFHMYLAVRPQYVRNHWLHRAGLVGFGIMVLGVFFAMDRELAVGKSLIVAGQFLALATSVASCGHPHQWREWEE
ncbi:MAG: hypothetical protein ACLFV7_07430 [Phycisphaerae bacterium]